MTARFLYLIRHGEAASEDGALTEAGRQQARLTGERLRDVPLTAIHHGPAARAVQTARLIGGYLPGVPLLASDLAGDYIPSDPDQALLPPSFASLVNSYPDSERAVGTARARAAIERFAVPGAGRADRHELVVTHNFLIGWFVRHALDAPDWRWIGLNQQNCALTIIRYQAGAPPALVSFNDAGHLTPALRWTGFPPGLPPAAG